MRRRRNVSHAIWTVVAAVVAAVPFSTPAEIHGWISQQLPFLPTWAGWLVSGGILSWRVWILFKRAEESP